HQGGLPSALFLKMELKHYNTKVMTPTIAKELDKLATQSVTPDEKQILFTKLQTFAQSHGMTIKIIKADHDHTYIYFETTTIKYSPGPRIGSITPTTLKSTDIPSGKHIVFLHGLLGDTIMGEIK
ncbi:MAG: hypothetical protein KAG04_02375, partial [Mycoplasmataceae bacterium]|nr:hypothetical protein [Mycoplasmataceae bacterium]